MSARPSDRNLLFGVLALHMDVISREALVETLRVWLGDKQRSLGELLVARGAISPEVRQRIEQMVDRRIADSQGDVELGLATVSSLGSLREELEELGDNDLQTSLRTIPRSAVSGLTSDALPTTSRHAGPTARFRILRMQDKGGMGVVWMAEDAELPRQVAVKEIKPEFAKDVDVRHRFQLEAEITGGLEHPGIVPVYGLGAFDDGRPFYVMRFIRGDSLKDAIERFHLADKQPQRDPTERSLALRDLLQRFLDVCDAIEYAHQRGILHRDLKPGNVMVGRFGETLVVDWGLAKVIGRPEESMADEETLRPPSASGSEVTLYGPIGTLQYMSPEQALDRQDQTGKASDVYGLGAILYTLLTGQPPRTASDRAELLQQAQRGEFTPVRVIQRGSPPALAAICEKALSPAPERRYASAAALADDLKHWLADEPVGALHDPLLTRLARWTRRHRTFVVGAAVALLVTVAGLTAGLLLLGVKNEELRVARDAAQSNADLADRRFRESKQLIDDWFTGVSESRELKDAPGLQPLRRKLLERAKSYYEQALDELQDNAELRSDAAHAYQRAGDISSMIGDRRDAVPALLASLRIREQLAHEFPNNLEYAAALANSQNTLGLTYLQIGQAVEAEQQHRQALESRERLVKKDPRNARFRQDLAGSYYNLGLVYIATGRLDLALEASQTSLEARRRLSSESPENATLAHDVTSSLHNVGMIHQRAGRFDEARVAYEESIEMASRLVAQRPADHVEAAGLADTHTNLGRLLESHGITEESLTHHRRSVEINERIVRENPLVHAYAAGLAASYTNYANALGNFGRTQDALEAYQKSVATCERLARENPADAAYVRELADSYNNLGFVLGDLNRNNEAISAHRRAIAILEPLAERNPSLTDPAYALAISYLNAGATLSNQGQPIEAQREYSRAVTICERLSAQNPAEVEYFRLLAMCHANLAVAYEQMGNMPLRMESARKARDLRVRSSREHPDNTDLALDAIRSEKMVASGYVDVGQRAEALEVYRTTVADAERLAERVPEDAAAARLLSEVRLELASVLVRSGLVDEAVPIYRATAELADRLAAEQPDIDALANDAAAAHHNFGITLTHNGRADQGLVEYQQALKVRERLAAKHPDDMSFAVALAGSYNDLGETLFDQGRTDEALPHFQNALSVREKLVREHGEVVALARDLAETQFNLGRFHQAADQVETARDWLQRSLDSSGRDDEKTPDALVIRARALCRLAELLPQPEAVAPEQAAKDRSRLLNDALAALQNAVARGYLSERLKGKAELAVLRDREEFRQLIGESSP